MISLSKIFGGLLFITLLLSFVIFKVAGIVPPTYLALYLLVFIYLLKERLRFNYDKYSKTFFIFVTSYFLYSVFITNDISSSIIYYLMWTLNIMVLGYFVNHKDIHQFTDIGSKILTLLAITSLILYLIGYNSTSHIYGVSLDKNFLVYLNLPFIYLSYLYRFKLRFYILTIATLLLMSRTFYVMVLIYFIFSFLMNFSIKQIGYAIFIGFSIPIFIFYVIPSDSFLITRITNGIELVSSITELIKDPSNYAFISEGLGDRRRFLLFAGNLQILKDTFPFGTGIGIQNYLSNMPNDLVRDLSGRPARAHNFYLSYLAEMGIWFFGLIYLLLKPFLINKKHLPIFMSLMAGLAFNEFITTPYFWMFIGLLINLSYHD